MEPVTVGSFDAEQGAKSSLVKNACFLKSAIDVEYFAPLMLRVGFVRLSSLGYHWTGPCRRIQAAT